jgi:hypothetical protein
VGPLTIELEQEMPIFIGASLIRETQLPRLLPRRFFPQVSGKRSSKLARLAATPRGGALQLYQLRARIEYLVLAAEVHDHDACATGNGGKGSIAT